MLATFKCVPVFKLWGCTWQYPRVGSFFKKGWNQETSGISPWGNKCHFSQENYAKSSFLNRSNKILVLFKSEIMDLQSLQYYWSLFFSLYYQYRGQSKDRLEWIEGQQGQWTWQRILAGCLGQARGTGVEGIQAQMRDILWTRVENI